MRLQGGTLGATVEGTVASQGLIYTVFARGNGTFLVPNNAALSATIVPLRTPAGVDVLARLREGVLPSELEQLLTREVSVPTRDDPDISLEEVYADSVVVRIQATPVSDADGPRLADEVLAVVRRWPRKRPRRAPLATPWRRPRPDAPAPRPRSPSSR